MNRSFRFGALLWLAAFLFSGSLANAATDRTPTLYGFLTESDEWRDDYNDPQAKFGYYTFLAEGNDALLPVSPIGPDNDWASYGGTYANGRFYSYSVNGNWMKYTLHFVAQDAATWQIKSSATFTYTNADKNSEESQKAYLVPADLAYDPINDIIYAAAKRFASQNDPYLCRVDRTTGELARIAEIPPMAALTAAANGNLLGIGIDGNLYSITATGVAAKIGHTGFYPNEGMNQSATCDYRSGYIYWACAGFASERDRQWNENGVYSVMRIDPATAETKVLRTFPRQERFSALSIMNAHPDSPDDIVDFSFVPAGYESAEGVLRFTVPAVTSVQNPITSALTVRLYIDSQLRETLTAAPGSAFSRTITGITSGAHTAAVEVEWNGHVGNRVFAGAFFGFDTPAKIEKVTLSCPEDDPTTAILSWEAPTTGENGSAYNPEKIRYRVVRYPDDVIVKRSLRETTLTETISSEYGPVYYIVTPYNIDNSGEMGRSTRSNTLMLGSDIVPPYFENFSTKQSMDSFTIIDVDGEGDPDNWETPGWKYDEQYACAFYRGRDFANADDYLVTPPIKFNPDRLYRLSYKYYGYYGYGNHFRVVVGNAATVEGLSREIQNIEKVTTAYDNPGLDAEVLFAVFPGDRFIGFHHMSQNMEHLSIDDIRVEDVGDARIPAAVGDMRALRLSSESYILSFTVPSVTANGKTLEGNIKATIVNNDVVAATLTDITPGQNVDWTNTAALKGKNNIVVYISNSHGDGLSSSTDIDLSDAVPQSVTGALATYVNKRQVEITWDPITSTVGENGNPIDLDEIRYMVFKPVATADGTDYRMIARDLTECRYMDDDPMLGCPNDAQQIVSYLVEPVNSAGEGYAAWTNGVVVGPSYTLPFAETWKEQTQETSPWMKTINNGATWYIRHQGYDPVATGQDGYGILSCEVNIDYDQGTGAIMSPRLDLTSMTDPKVSFYYYRSPEYQAGIYLMVAALIEGDNELHYFPNILRPQADTKGWEKVELSLADFATESRVSIMLLSHVTLNNTVHIDNFRVEGSAKRDIVRAEYITGSANCRQYIPTTFTGTIYNFGANAVSNITATLKAGTRTIGTKTVASVAANGSADVTFDYTPDAAGDAVLSFEAGSGKVTKEIKVEEFNPATVTDLNGSIVTDGVKLSWGAPTLTENPQFAIDSFEQYDPFAITSMGGWTLYDGDGFLPFRFSDGAGGLLEWPNCDKTQAFIAFNPSQLKISGTPSAYAGSQYLVGWCSPYGANNDWLISPELPGCKQMISIMARSFGGGDDRFHIYVSHDGTDPDDFTSLTGISPVKVNDEWNIYYFGLPEGTRHFAIVNVSDRQDGLLIDDVMFYGNHNHYTPDGFNVYRNGTRLNSTVVAGHSFTDANAERGGTNNYTVRAVYNGRESLDSNVFFTDGLTAIDGIDFDSASAAAVSAVAGGIEVTGAAHNAIVSVYAADGTLVASATGNGTIALLPGVYVVKVDTTVAKVAVR